jgi:hypothetical protein
MVDPAFGARGAAETELIFVMNFLDEMKRRIN